MHQENQQTPGDNPILNSNELTQRNEAEIDKIDPHKLYFDAINHLLALGYPPEQYGFKKMSVTSKDNSLSVRILRHQTNNLDKVHKSYGDTITCSDKTKPERFPTASLEANFTTGENNQLTKIPEGELGSHLEETILAIRELSKTEGSSIYVNNTQVLISDGESWVEAEIYKQNQENVLTSGAPQIPSEN